MAEVTSGVKSGLKSWLGFGTSVVAGKQLRKSTMSESDGGPAASRLRVMYRESTSEATKYDADMGPPTANSSKKGGQRAKKSDRVATALANITQGDVKQTRKAEDQIRKVSKCSAINHMTVVRGS